MESLVSINALETIYCNGIENIYLSIFNKYYILAFFINLDLYLYNFLYMYTTFDEVLEI